MSVLVIYNPAAGGGKSRLNALIDALKKHDLEVETYQTQKAGDATDFLKKRTKKDQVVVAVGGDGTTREIINGLDGSTPVAIFANGTANVLANELSLPRSASATAKMITQGHTLPVQFGCMHKQRFCMWIGIGFDAWVVAQTSLKLKRKIGKAAYALSMLIQAFRYGRYQYEIKVDGTTYTSYSAVITHARFYGGHFVISQKANLLTPKLHVLLFQKPSRGFFFKALFALLLGKMESVEGVISLPFDKLEAHLKSDDLNPQEKKLAGVLQADGDVIGQLPLTVTLDKTSVPVLVEKSLADRLKQK